MSEGCGCKHIGGKCENWKSNVVKICQQLDVYIDFVFDHEKEFLAKFALEAYDLTNIYFSTERIKIYYILESGQHVTDSIETKDFVTWMESIK